MPEFTPQSRIVDVVRGHPDGREILYRHGLNLGEGFVDILSQYETLREAAREGRLRAVPELVRELNRAGVS